MNNEFGLQFVANYQMYLSALNGSYMMVMGSPTISALGSFTSNAVELRKTFLRTTVEQLYYLDKGYVGPSPVLEEETNDFLKEIERVSKENIKTLSNRIRGVDRTINAALKGMGGALGVLANERTRTPDFRVMTASGRSYEAVGYVKSQAFYISYQYSLVRAMNNILDAGNDLAEVSYEDDSHVNHGTVFSISGTTKGYPTYQSLRKEVFHYNAKARIVPHVSA